MKSIKYLALAFLTLTIGGCSENIDDSNLYTFTGEMMIDHFANDTAKYGKYLEILKMVHLSKKSESTMYELLSARGNYTCFAPTNDAIDHYLDSLLHLEEPQVSSTNINEIPDSIAESIVFNSIIDNGNSEAYSTTTGFGTGALNKTNMNDRYINLSYGNDSTGKTLIFVNANSVIIDKDIEVENGYIHSIDKVLSPSTSTVADLIIGTENLSFFGDLLTMTGWNDKLLSYKDEDYELNNENAGEKRDNSGASGWAGSYPEKRYFGYTVFVEPDSIFAEKGINSIDDLKQYLKSNAYYGSKTSWGEDYTNPDNYLNQFVAYHILPERLIWDQLVIFANEKGFTNASPNRGGKKFNINVWEYYETMDYHRRSIKITGTRSEKLINRHATYNLISYKEKADGIDIPGIKISDKNGKYDNNALNGFYYPINDLLVWTESVPKKILNERMRYDICSLLPELMTNGCRRNETQCYYFTYDYFTSKNGGSGAIPIMSKQTDFAYLSNYQNEGSSNVGGSGTWTNYQADEFNIRGKYDFVMKLPPVPYTGTYEIRYGVNANNNRGMAQIYLGTNPNNLPAVGIPIDLRIGGDNAMVGWKSDADLGSDDAIQEKDKQMRNNGYMKGPAYFFPGSASGRDCLTSIRKIIFTGTLEEGKTYYIRFKSVLDSSSTQFFFDYLEFVPKTIYNGDIPEDKW